MLRFMCSNGGIYRAYRVFRLMYTIVMKGYIGHIGY